MINMCVDPIGKNGRLELTKWDGVTAKSVGIEQFQLEQDTAKLLDWKEGQVLVDLNRCGGALLEIVMRPELQ
jgi:Asp-tRNA(Asn)/Glu-tRNA(Gln) amidotransferase B subunit